eukprot:CAMPEP_0197298760 /NCGR_PEP_ID=MMETSP0890-20130614/44299_1 /TAXON_ID=44058 ORGANISM="Aureoumbra lagunensis, Strain CCMP1510" /NCGR_SAMPLE_ID=MMETSP0890 /ASSEMBLY_ACC=CAM_ASM_000533 /LENGTH=486 /DNA_ID=CAMNT_0042776693 /DNA_START=173 /DNA_END=1633 /DNA_ORIENTATION=+
MSEHGELSPNTEKRRTNWRRPSGKLEVVEIRNDGTTRNMVMRMRDLMRHINSVTSEDEYIADSTAQQLASRSNTPPANGESDTDFLSQAGDDRPRHRALHARDLRSIDPQMTQKAGHPAIVVRRHVIIANFDPLRVVIVYDRMLVLIPVRQRTEKIVDELLSQLKVATASIIHVDSSDSIATNVALESSIRQRDTQDYSEVVIFDEEQPSRGENHFFSSAEDGVETDIDDDTFHEVDDEIKFPPREEENIKKDLPPKTRTENEEPMQPFELRALEAVLAVATRRLSTDCEALRPRAAQATEMLRSAGMSIEKLERLRKLKNEVSYHEARARDTAEALAEVLDEDEDMCMMRLSKLRTHPFLFNPPLSPALLTQHEDVELLLENYLQYTTATQTDLELLRLGIDNAESSFAMNLDIARNRLISVDTIFTLLSTIAGFGGVTAGIFGMNLQRDQTSFLLVTSLTVIACIFIALAIIGLLFKFNLLLLR